MKLEDFFNQQNIVDLSFFNFRNAITAAYFANKDLEILRVNDNFRKFFPVLGNVTNAYFPDILEQLGVSGAQRFTDLLLIGQISQVRILAEAFQHPVDQRAEVETVELTIAIVAIAVAQNLVHLEQNRVFLPVRECRDGNGVGWRKHHSSRRAE